MSKISRLPERLPLFPIVWVEEVPILDGEGNEAVLAPGEARAVQCARRYLDAGGHFGSYDLLGARCSSSARLSTFAAVERCYSSDNIN
jgi:hypothetical protein